MEEVIGGKCFCRQPSGMLLERGYIYPIWDSGLGMLTQVAQQISVGKYIAINCQLSINIRLAAQVFYEGLHLSASRQLLQDGANFFQCPIIASNLAGGL